MPEYEYPPQIDDAPGLVWRRRVNNWVATWQARTDLVKRGFTPKTAFLWTGTEPTSIDKQGISDQCNRLQTEMLVWARGGLPDAPFAFDGTLRSLSECYQLDRDSGFYKKEHKSRLHYVTLIRIVLDQHGHEYIRDIKARTVLRWHEEWTKRGVAMAHSLVRMLRTMIIFGSTILEDAECQRIGGALSQMRFVQARPRTERLTAEHAIAVREMAHKCGVHSVALAQAFQFDCMLRQKDVIGEWMPQAEPGLSDVLAGNDKWVKGIRWEEIDGDMILRHVTSKRKKLIEVDLKLCPMVIEELNRLGERGTHGPIIICEWTLRPWDIHAFRNKWRKIARLAGVPDIVRNMDSRAGAISEATDAGADLEHVRHAATHGDISMTMRYSRNTREKTDNVLRLRAEHRNKK